VKRRAFIKAALALPAARALAQPKAAPRVVVVGAGYGGATAAKYLRMWSDGAIDVTLVDGDPAFVSCPLSNLVVGGSKTLADITVGYEGLVKRGVKVRVATAQAVDASRSVVRLRNGDELAYDRLVLSPGVTMQYDQVEGMASPDAREKIVHAWKAGPQTLALRRQLEAMRDGGVFVISIPRAPYRCPPGPYERACQAAWYFKRAKPRSKVLVLDGNEEITSKRALFTHAFNEDYKGIVEYRPNFVLTGVDAATLTAKFETEDDVKADVLNVIPPQRAGDIAQQAGVITANGKWCEVDFLTFESIKVPKVHVLGDAIQIAPLMPKSGHMANQHAKVAAAAVINLLAGQPPDPEPVLSNACYSFITDKDTVHVDSVHQYDREKRTFMTVPGSGGLSAQPNAIEGEYAFAWARNIWSDMLT
jgi:NADPH-dependent 2,4-dienoyl-CoA reductase/sulfur reductase-like enzyme